MTRRKNQSSGAFFVKSFFANGPKTLSELKTKLSNGETEWIDRLSYFTKTVVGSSAFWRQKKKEVYSWINYHLDHGNGRPTFFITLSCAEYQWKDVQRLIKERMTLAGHNPHLFETNITKYTNEYSIVVQEYFQERVRLWLEIIGTKVFSITHYWLRFEFATSRGQIHAHMLAICDQKHINLLEKHILHNPTKKTAILSEWVQRSFNMTAMVDYDQQMKLSEKNCHPSSLYYKDIKDHNLDQYQCQIQLQNHECSSYCLRKSIINKDVRWCNKTCSHEANPGKGDTPGFRIIKEPEIVKDPRGYCRLELPRNHPRIVQTSIFLLQGWRANVDIQLLLYDTTFDKTTASDVSKISDYIISYICKGTETSVQEKIRLKDLVLNSTECTGDINDVKRVSRHIMNEATKNRIISKQESMCHIGRLPLFLC